MLSRKNSVLVVALTILAVLVGTAGLAQAALVANWKLQDTSGSTVVDSVGGYTGTLNTNTSYLPTLGQTSPTPVIGTYSCLFNGGTSSDGSNQSNGRLSNITTTLNQNGWAAATWSAWIYLPSSMQPTGSVQQGIFEDNSSSDKMYLRLAASGSYSYTSANNNTDCNSGLSSPPSYNAWHLVTLTYDSGASSNRSNIYLDGVLKAQSSPSGTLIMTYFAMGGNSGNIGYSLRGNMEDMGIWNNALNQAQTMAVDKAPLTFTADAAAGYYGCANLQSLFALYAAQTGSVGINGKTWSYSANLATSLPGLTLPGIPSGVNSAVDNVGIYAGADFIQLDASGGGVYTTAVPEPGTLALLGAGLIGLLCYAWRKRR